MTGVVTQQHAVESTAILNCEPELARLRNIIQEKERAMEGMSRDKEKLVARLASVEVSIRCIKDPTIL